MLYQIQKYNLSNYSQREIIAQSQDLPDVESVTQWVADNTPSVVANGFGVATVPQDHAWYVQVETVPTVEAEPVESGMLNGPTATFDAVAKYELARSIEERTRLHEQLLAEKNNQQ